MDYCVGPVQVLLTIVTEATASVDQVLSIPMPAWDSPGRAGEPGFKGSLGLAASPGVLREWSISTSLPVTRTL